MRVGDFCSRDVATVDSLASLREAAILMRNKHVGALVVLEGSGASARPAGLLTDRDIVVAVIAVPGARPEGVRAVDAMSQPLATAYEDDGVFEAVGVMRKRAVRRLPILARDGTLRGMVTLDDLLSVIATELANLGEAVRLQRRRELAARKPI